MLEIRLALVFVGAAMVGFGWPNNLLLMLVGAVLVLQIVPKVKRVV